MYMCIKEYGRKCNEETIIRTFRNTFIKSKPHNFDNLFNENIFL